MKKVKTKIVDWDDHIDNKYGRKGSRTREKFEQELEAFKIGVLIQEARKQKK